MARTKKVAFNVRDLLFPEQHVPFEGEIAAALAKSPLLPIVAQVYTMSEKTLRVGVVERDGTNGAVRKVNMVTPEGLSVCAVGVSGRIGSGGHVSFYTPWNSHENSINRVTLNTTNPRYLQSKLKDEDHTVHAAFHNSLEEAKKFIGGRMRGVLDQMIDASFGASISSVPQFQIDALDSNLTTFMGRLVAGEVTMAEMSSSMRQQFDTEFNKFKQLRQKFLESIQKGREFLDGEKWFFMPNINNGVLLGAVDPQPMLAALDHYANGSCLPFEASNFTYLNPTVPFKWYKSFKHIPEDLRSGLEYSLAMLKVHLGSDKLIPEGDGFHFWHEMGGYAHLNRGLGHSSVFLLAK